MLSSVCVARRAGLILQGLWFLSWGWLISTGSEVESSRLLDTSGEVIGTATIFFEELTRIFDGGHLHDDPSVVLSPHFLGDRERRDFTHVRTGSGKGMLLAGVTTEVYSLIE